MKAVVVGGSGFVGRATTAALERRGVDVTVMRAPRLDSVPPAQTRGAAQSEAVRHTGLVEAMRGQDVVINAAGQSNASSGEVGSLIAANSVLPAVLAWAATEAGTGRFVHVSSAAVQGQAPVLNESRERRPFSAYSRSKALAEELLEEVDDPRVVVYRPPGVHGPERQITQMLSRVAASPLSTVASPGTCPTPQSHIENVADAIAYLATCTDQPPRVVIHPWEGHSTAQFLEILGGRVPRQLPRLFTTLIITILGRVATLSAPLAANARRLDMMWHGQAQAPSWLTEQGWSPPAGMDEWRELSRNTRTKQAKGDKV